MAGRVYLFIELLLPEWITSSCLMVCRLTSCKASPCGSIWLLPTSRHLLACPIKQ